MKRRDFIRLGGFLTVSAATMGMTGCDIEGEDDDQSLFPSATPEPVRAMPAAATGASWKFPQSIASADPRPDSIILWTRVVPTTVVGATASSNTNTAIRLVVTAADNSANIGTTTALSGTLVADVTVPAYADFDNSVRHKLTGLSAASVYYYQFIAGDVRSNVGRFKTAPATASSDDVKFIFMSCQNWSANHWGAFDQIVTDDIGGTPANPDVDFIVHLGDYIYETDDNATAPDEASKSAIILPVGAALQPSSTEKSATELADYRYLYKLYRSDDRIQNVHERFPMVAVWDDHEFSDDGWQTAETYTNANSPMFQRRRNANQAWFEFMPADVSFSEVDPGFQNIKLYRDLKFGATMHLVMTDERLYRQDHLIPESSINPSTCLPLGRINSRYLAPEASLMSAELQKDFAGAPLGPLGLITILGQTQRDWWKSTMSNSTSTWKVWGNEVSLLRMGLNGTNALATLIALGSVSTLATNIGNASVSFGGNFNMASAFVGAATFGATTSPSGGAAGAGAVAIATSDAGGGTPADMIAAAVGAGLSVTQATVAVTAYLASKAATAGGPSAQATAGAGAIAIGTPVNFGATDISPCIRNDIRTNKTASPFFISAMAAADTAGGLPAGTSAAKVAPFFQKFVLNADQWDGYRKERANLMNHLIDNSIQNVVAVTGDIHAFFAGTVYNEFAGEVTGITSVTLPTSCAAAYPTGNFQQAVETTASAGGTAAMVDLVVAGISSNSWFNYIKEQADILDPANALIGKLVYAPVPVAAPADAFYPGSPAISFTVYLNLLDYTMGRVLTGADDTARKTTLAAQLNQQIKRKLGEAGFVEPAIDGSALSIQGSIAGSSSFNSALALAKLLSALGVSTNPWLSALGGGHVDTEAQGYAIVTATTGNLVCQFKKLNPIVGSVAPSSTRRVVSTTTATVTAGTPAVVIS